MLPLATILPPYDRFDPASHVQAMIRPPFGAILAIHIAHGETDIEHVAATARALRRRYPYAPQVLQLTCGIDHTVLGVVGAAGRNGIRCALSPERKLDEALRHSALTVFSPDDWLVWLTSYGFELDSAAAAILSNLARAAASQCRSNITRELCGASPRTARAVLGRSGLAGPSEMLSCLMAINAAMQLQRHPQHKTGIIAVKTGFDDDRALRHQFKRLFGLKTREVRQVLGWEPLLYRWATRLLQRQERTCQ